MPRPAPPPTPGSSSDIRGKEGMFAAPSFQLPPTAFQEQADRASTSSATPSANGSDSSYQPVSPNTSADQSRKRTASQQAGVITKDDFALPPPPTRSRKIIQMKPRENEQQEQPPQSTGASPQIAGKAPANTQTAAGKKKQSNTGTTAAGRKIARKTAHSLIERRRRSKMNEEFGVLKDMIPACKGQEMHKLAILQASIEYLRYLEQCVSDLQAQHQSPHSQPLPPAPAARSQAIDDEEDEDEEMEDDDDSAARSGPATTTTTPAMSAYEHSGSIVSLPSLSQITTNTSTSSPSVFAAGAGRHYSISSAASQPSYSPYFHSNQASPAFGPQLHHISTAPSFSGAFGLGSPALKPVDASAPSLRQIAEGANELSEKQRLTAAAAAAAAKANQANGKSGRSEHELDQEATAALLMLNNDRRSWRAGQHPPPPPPPLSQSQLQPQPESDPTSRSSTGMSVRDLLSG